jgi:hypothetical protein
MQRLYEQETIGTLAPGSNLTLPPDEAGTSTQPNSEPHRATSNQP